MHTPGPWTKGRHLGITAIINGEETQVAAACVMPCIGGHDDIHAQRGADMEQANARLIAASPDGLEAAKLAYAALLRTPHDRLRTKAQSALSSLRDFIASATGQDAETVQDDFESARCEELLGASAS